MKILNYCIAALSVAFMAMGASAQTDKIDSLEKVIAKAGEDTVKARSLCRLCWELRKKGRYNEALKTGEEGLNLAQQGKDNQGLASCLLNLGVVYANQGDYEKAAGYFLKSLKIKQGIGDKHGTSSCLTNLGNVYYGQGDYGKAADFYLNALKIREEIGDKKGISACLMNLGIVSKEQGDYGKAADYYLKSLKIYEEHGDKYGVGNCLNNLGGVYFNQEDYGKAEDCYLKSLKIREEIGDEYGVSSCLGNLGVIYKAQENYGKASEYLLKSLKINEELGDKNSIAVRLNNLGGVYHDSQLDYGKAADYYLKSLKIREEIGDKNGIAECWLNLSRVYLKTGRVTEARTLARKGLTLATEIGNMETMCGGALALALSDSAAGDFQSAFKHFRLYHEYSDSLRNDEQTKKIAQLEARRQYELEAAERKRQEEITAAEEAERQERVYMLQSLGIFGFIMLMVMSLFFLGKLNLPRWTLNGLLYVSLIMTFEFAVMLFDPLNDKYSEGLPIYKMLFNTLLALGIGPLHGLAERKLAARLEKSAREAANFKRPFDDRE